MDIIEVSENIKDLIKEIGTFRREIREKGKNKAESISNYDRKMAVTLATLRNSETYELGGKIYKQPPVSIAEKIAKGICYEERLAMELAESRYKATISNLSALQAQLNGYQSIFRWLDET